MEDQVENEPCSRCGSTEDELYWHGMCPTCGDDMGAPERGCMASIECHEPPERENNAH